MSWRASIAAGRASWQISLETLLKKSGSQSSIKRFRQMVKHIAKHDHLPDYHLVFDEDRDMVIFFNRDGKWVERPLPSDGETLPRLPDGSLSRKAARRRPAMTSTPSKATGGNGGRAPASRSSINPAAAFVGFCRSRHKRAPLQRESDRNWD